MHVIACPNHPPVISWPHEFQHLLLFVLGWRKVNWELHVGWRLRVACSPVSRHFGIFRVPKWATTSSKWSKTTCFSVAHGLGSFLRKVIFLPLLDPVDPFGHPPVWASACSLPQPSGPRHWGLGVLSSNSEGWKPQKVGGCGWNRCPRNRILSHAAKDMAYSWFVAVGIWSFWGPF